MKKTIIILMAMMLLCTGCSQKDSTDNKIGFIYYQYTEGEYEAGVRYPEAKYQVSKIQGEGKAYIIKKDAEKEELDFEEKESYEFTLKKGDVLTVEGDLVVEMESLEEIDVTDCEKCRK